MELSSCTRPCGRILGWGSPIGASRSSISISIVFPLSYFLHPIFLLLRGDSFSIKPMDPYHCWMIVSWNYSIWVSKSLLVWKMLKKNLFVPFFILNLRFKRFCWKLYIRHMQGTWSWSKEETSSLGRTGILYGSNTTSCVIGMGLKYSTSIE